MQYTTTFYDRKGTTLLFKEIDGILPITLQQDMKIIIDDDKQFHDRIHEELQSHGYDLERAFGGQEGLEKESTTHPDVVILDLMMPGMSGFEVAEMLKRNRETSSIPILVMTSKELTAADRSALQSRISGLIPKGQSKARLLGAIQELERLRARDAAR